ncbi:MFS transporter [Clostridium thermarum]|uniref:MFS transporter n=1 Tax=Clostridium thermarum TaxID=1716543 RepID=UPI0011237846|nr:MFS transporter [Clostridium thermarum]
MTEEREAKVFKDRWWILLIVVISPFMSTLDSSIVNVALPVMADEMSVDMASIEWVVTSYLIVISGTILFFGRLGDIKGKTTVFKWGFFIFTLGSLFCGIAKTLPMLIISRVVQAIGAAGTMANSQGIITHIFPSKERGRALGISATAVALGTMIGPPLGGLIVSAFKWQYIFLINVPVGIVAIIAAMRILPKGARKDESIDLKGAILFGISIALTFYTLSKGQQIGYGNSMIITAFAAAMVLLIAFIMLERRIVHPLLDLTIFKNTIFSLSIFTAFISFTSIGSVNILQPFYLQNVIKLTAAATGLVMMIYPITVSIVAPISGSLSDKVGSEFLTFLGLLFTLTGLFLMSTLNEYSSIGTMAIFTVILGIGNGLFQSPNNSLVMSAATQSKLGIAGSINAFVRNLGMVTGVSISTTLLYSTMSNKLGTKVSGYVAGRDDVFVYGMRYVYITAGLICSVGVLLTAVRLYQNKKLKIRFKK